MKVTSVSVKKIEKDLKLNFILRDQIEEIKEKIYG